MRRFQDERGFSAWHLVLIFLGAVAVCAVFFSLGFVVGYNHRPASPSASTENVTMGGNIPPTVNTPLGSSAQMTQENVTPETAAPSPVGQPQEASPQPPGQPQAEPATSEAQEPAHRAAPRSRVERKPPPSKEAHASPVLANHQKGRFQIQVIASRTKSDAITLIRLLEARRYHVFLVSPQRAHAGDNLYRVRVGPFPTRAAAERIRQRLEKQGFKPFIVH